MANKETVPPALTLKDLHPILQTIFNFGAEIDVGLDRVIKIKGEEKTALNLSSQIKIDRSKVVGKEFIILGGNIIEIPRFEEKIEYGVRFAVEKNQKINDDYGFGISLSNVFSQEQGIKELETIVSDLQKIYGLSYTPKIYVNGKPVEQMQQKPG